MSGALGPWLGLILLAGVLAAWVAVQQAWRRSFPAQDADPDALSGRLGCAGTSCQRPCPHRHVSPYEEETP